ncbi:MAG TPA: SH3 domain-containing protein, partial [Gammaproteobacteria bacterium]|nr:SH3 domain-containing protein [Gammaproteobacteria bacterium]
MRHPFLLSIFFFAVFCFTACRSDSKTHEAAHTNGSNQTSDTTASLSATQAPVSFTTNLDNVRLREKPGLEGKELLRLPLGTTVYDAREVSDFTTSLNLRGVSFNEPWLKVKTETGITGWIYGGALTFSLESGDAVMELLMQRRLTGIFGQDLSAAIEKYRRHYKGISTAAELSVNYDEGIALRDKMVEMLRQKIEIAYPDLPDLFWLREAMPPFVPQLVREGTEYYLFYDFKAFSRKAAQTVSPEDDEMAQIFLKAYRADSIEYFYPAWFLQISDEGGYTLLGRGIHLDILEHLDTLHHRTDLFSKPIATLKNAIVEDITAAHPAYWESKQKVINELKQIIIKRFDLLSSQDMVALETRLKMLKEAKKNNITFDL